MVSMTTTRALCGWWRWLEWTVTCAAGPMSSTSITSRSCEAPTHREQAGLDAALLCKRQQGVQPAGEPSEPDDCRQTFPYTISCTGLFVLSSGPEDYLAAVKKLQEEGRASAKVCAFVCLCMLVCVWMCMVHGWSKLCAVPLMQHSRTLLRDLAVMLATQHLQQDPPTPLAVFHR